MGNRKTIVISNSAKIVTSVTMPNPRTLATRTTGLYLEVDDTPTTGAMGTGYAGLYDEDFTVAALPMLESESETYYRSYPDHIFRPTGIPWRFDVGAETTTSPIGSPEYSFGLYLSATAVSVRKISIWDDGTAGAGVYWDDENECAAYDVYGSDDNATWVLVKHFNPVERTAVELPDTDVVVSPMPSPFPASPTDDNTVYRTDLVLDSTISTKYVKVHAVNGSVKSASGSYIVITEMQCFADATTRTQTFDFEIPKVVHTTRLAPVYDTDTETYDTVDITEQHAIED